LTGGFSPTGTIRFELEDPNGITVDTETVTASGNGTHATPTGYTFTPATPGTYTWLAQYLGDSSNLATPPSPEVVDIFTP
jgi:hypothetical protein